MPKVHIVQLLCAERHCLLCVGFEEGNGNLEKSIEMLEELKRGINLNPWCALCGSRELHYEEHVTPFDSLKEAAPVLSGLQFAELAAREYLDRIGASYDSRRAVRNN